MILTFQIYLHDLVGAAINVGPRLKPDMVLHHATAMIMIFIGYCINLNRYAIMWQVRSVSTLLWHFSYSRGAWPCLQHVERAHRVHT